MAAHVLERAKFAVVASNDEHRVVAAPVLEVVTGLGDVVDRAGDLPYLRPHPLGLELREGRRVIALGGHQGGRFGGVPIASSRWVVGGVADRRACLRCVRHDRPLLIRRHPSVTVLH